MGLPPVEEGQECRDGDGQVHVSPVAQKVGEQGQDRVAKSVRDEEQPSNPDPPFRCRYFQSFKYIFLKSCSTIASCWHLAIVFMCHYLIACKEWKE